MRNLRKKIWIDRFQTYLSLRMTVYFVLYQAAVWSLVAIERRMVDLEETLGGAGVAYSSVITPVAVVVLAALFIYDAVVLAHRIVGPLYRFRKTIQAITAGGEVQPVVLRKNDYLTEMAGDINEMLLALEQRGLAALKQADVKQNHAQPVAI